jgi:hypothetical protein
MYWIEYLKKKNFLILQHLFTCRMHFIVVLMQWLDITSLVLMYAIFVKLLGKEVSSPFPVRVCVSGSGM